MCCLSLNAHSTESRSLVIAGFSCVCMFVCVLDNWICLCEKLTTVSFFPSFFLPGGGTLKCTDRDGEVEVPWYFSSSVWYIFFHDMM